MELLFIHWNPNEIICHLGPLALRWYSTLWLIGLLAAYFCAQYLYKKHGKSSKDFEPLFLYCFVGILAGARLGHCLFYQPDYFLSSGTHIIEMFLPIRKFADGSWHFIGYEGLASHGGTIGLIIGLLLFLGLFAASAEKCEDHEACKKKCYDFLHLVFLHKIICFFILQPYGL